jgi:nucleoside-diphosphate-sugar epimerase
MQTKTATILGANGRLGIAVAQAFDAAGWQVLAQTRRPLEAAIPRSASRLDIPLSDVDALARASEGASVVVHAVNPLYTQRQQLALPCASAGMDLAQRLGALFMFPGNVYNFGESMPPLIQLDTPERPSTEKGAIRVAMEVEMAARSAYGLRSVVVHAGDFFGANSGTWLHLAIAKSLRAGKLVYPGPLDIQHAWAYLPDFARCFAAVAELPHLPPRARFHFPGHTLTGAQLLDAIEHEARALGIYREPLRRCGFPWWVLRAAGWAVPMWREAVKMSYLWRVPHALDGQRLERAIGPLPHTPLLQAVRASLLAMGFVPANYS